MGRKREETPHEAVTRAMREENKQLAAEIARLKKHMRKYRTPESISKAKAKAKNAELLAEKAWLQEQLDRGAPDEMVALSVAEAAAAEASKVVDAYIEKKRLEDAKRYRGLTSDSNIAFDSLLARSELLDNHRKRPNRESLAPRSFGHQQPVEQAQPAADPSVQPQAPAPEHNERHVRFQSVAKRDSKSSLASGAYGFGEEGEEEDNEPLVFSAGGLFKNRQHDELLRTTHFSRKELQHLYRAFKNRCPSGQVSRGLFQELCAELQHTQSKNVRHYADTVFQMFDTDNSGTIGFDEYITFLSVSARGTRREKLELIFRIHDDDNNGRLDKDEIRQLAATIYRISVAQGSTTETVSEEGLAGMLLSALDVNGDGMVTQDEFVTTCERNSMVASLVDLSIDDADVKSMKSVRSVRSVRPGIPAGLLADEAEDDDDLAGEGGGYLTVDSHATATMGRRRSSAEYGFGDENDAVDPEAARLAAEAEERAAEEQRRLAEEERRRLEAEREMLRQQQAALEQAAAVAGRRERERIAADRAAKLKAAEEAERQRKAAEQEAERKRKAEQEEEERRRQKAAEVQRRLELERQASERLARQKIELEKRQKQIQDEYVSKAQTDDNLASFHEENKLSKAERLADIEKAERVALEALQEGSDFTNDDAILQAMRQTNPAAYDDIMREREEERERQQEEVDRLRLEAALVRREMQSADDAMTMVQSQRGQQPAEDDGEEDVEDGDDSPAVKLEPLDRQAQAKLELERRKAKIKARKAEAEQRKKDMKDRRMSAPKLDKVDHSKYASERERQLAEADVGATENRLQEMSFNFTFG